MTSVPGTGGYAQAARGLLQTRLTFAEVHAPILHLIPTAPSDILDIGAGPGHDAATFAATGHRVVAVEPFAPLRLPAMALYPSPRIQWVDDSLPDLDGVTARRQCFAFILISGVWMHLDPAERLAAMPRVAALLSPDGAVAISLRHGAVPQGRRMFEVSAPETIALAHAAGLRLRVNVETASVQAANRAAGVTWTHLAFGQGNA